MKSKQPKKLKMKKSQIISAICFFLAVVSGYGQYNSIGDFSTIQLSYAKTTSILFPYGVKSLDIGSRDVLVQQAKGVQNVLLLKAGRKNFEQTNLTVVTSDARLYVFLLNYDEVCPDLHITAENTSGSSKEILFSQENENEKEIEQLAVLALSKAKKASGLQKSRHQISLEVNGIFISKDVLYIRVVFANKSKMKYDIDQLRFFIRDRSRSKRTASQEIELQWLYTTSVSEVIPDKSEVVKVYALEKFTIPENKHLTLQLMEKNGGRNLEVNIKNKSITEVFPIQE